MAAIVGFAMVTRFEPSVLRAAFVAGVALFARTTGRPSGGIRHLSLAVCVLLVVDPLLVDSLGFRLSVAASVGVLVIAPRIVARTPGPRWVREGFGVTAGAQLAVAPVLVPVLGPLPLAALPANVVAGPVAGALMVWGVAAGTVAGAVGGRAAAVLHLPSAAGLTVLERVASVGASLPMGQLDLRHLAVLAGAASLLRPARAATTAAAAVLATVALAAPMLTPVSLGAHPAGFDATVWTDGPAAVVDIGARADPADVVQALRTAHVTAVGLVVVRTARPSAGAVIDAIGARFPVGAVIGPHGLDVADLVVPPPGFRARVGRLRVVVDRPGPPLRARIGWATGTEAAWAPAVGSSGAPGARSPPVRHHVPSRGDGHPEPHAGFVLRRRPVLGLR